MFTEEMVVTTHVFNQMDHDTNKLPVLLRLQNVMCLCVLELTLSRSGLETKFISQACFRLSIFFKMFFYQHPFYTMEEYYEYEANLL